MEEDLTIRVDLVSVLRYINTDDFKDYLFSTADISTALFIIDTMNKTIEYMLQDEE